MRKSLGEGDSGGTTPHRRTFTVPGIRPHSDHQHHQSQDQKISMILSDLPFSTVIEIGELMRATYRNIVLHFVWATRDRLPFIAEGIEGRLHRMIQAKARELGCQVIAINGMPDHVHLLVQMPTILSPSELMQKIKGASSGFARITLRQGEAFSWQHGYGVFSVGPNQITRVAEYIHHQKHRHAEKSTWPSWETPPDSLAEGDGGLPAS